MRCTLGVGCEEAGICYAIAHGQPEQCGRRKSLTDNLPSKDGPGTFEHYKAELAKAEASK